MTFNAPSLIKSKNNLFNRRNMDVENIFNDLLNTFYDSNYSRAKGAGDYFSAKFDVSETKAAYLIEADLPGMTEKNIDINIDNNILTIQGKKETKTEEKEKNYHMRERSYGEFTRSLVLPTNIDSSKIEATFKNGVLEVKIPKAEASTSYKIEVKS